MKRPISEETESALRGIKGVIGVEYEKSLTGDTKVKLVLATGTSMQKVSKEAGEIAGKVQLVLRISSSAD
ncbi:MAG: hypothetical protein ACD_65C00360G0001 [uncultured bacterium]|nr:MAG: hypothetical protein ACD_65C00360G0001 [uncultured bacterium]